MFDTKKITDATLHVFDPASLLALLQTALVAARAQHQELLDRLRVVYSGPVTEGFLWFKKTRPATQEEIEGRLSSSRNPMSDTWDSAWHDVFSVEDNIATLEKLLKNVQTSGVEQVHLSNHHLSTINWYLA